MHTCIHARACIHASACIHKCSCCEHACGIAYALFGLQVRAWVRAWVHVRANAGACVCGRMFMRAHVYAGRDLMLFDVGHGAVAGLGDGQGLFLLFLDLPLQGDLALTQPFFVVLAPPLVLLHHCEPIFEVFFDLGEGLLLVSKLALGPDRSSGISVSVYLIYTVTM